MKDLLRSVVKSLAERITEQKATLRAVDYMDDGSKICLCVNIDGQKVGESSKGCIAVRRVSSTKGHGEVRFHRYERTSLVQLERAAFNQLFGHHLLSTSDDCS